MNGSHEELISMRGRVTGLGDQRVAIAMMRTVTWS